MGKELKAKELNEVSGGSIGEKYYYRLVNNTTGAASDWNGPYDTEAAAKAAGEAACSINETVETKKSSGFTIVQFGEIKLNL